VPGEAESNTSAGVTRLDLLRWVWPHSEQACVALHAETGGDKPRIGWVYDAADAKRAIAAFANGTLASERFETRTKQGKPYAIEHATRLGLVLHRKSEVRVCCLDLDDHTDDGGNVHQLGPISRFLGAEPVVFTSKGGKGLHAFFELRDAMPVDAFVRRSKMWGFNREGQPELFPKTAKLTQLWMPGEPNEHGGDTYQSGTFESAVIQSLPEPPPIPLTNAALSFLRGERWGYRNNGYNDACYALGIKRIDQQKAESLCKRGAKLCGLETEETKHTFESGYNAGLKDSPVAASDALDRHGRSMFELDGIGHAERFALMHKDLARYCLQEGQWYVYKTNRWVQSPVEAQALAKETARTIEDQSCRRKASSKPGIKEILYLASSEPGMSVDATAFDGDPMRFNCLSGTIDLRTGTLGKHDPADLLRQLSPVRYEPSKACPRWLEFLGMVFGGDAELIAYIQRVCGYILTGDVSEQCLFFLFGDGCNGKSVLCSVLQHILGSYAVRVPAELVMKPPRGTGNGPTPDAARLLGARLAVASELEDGHTLGEARVKDLTGGDRRVARPLYGQPIEFSPTDKMVLYGNHKPEIRNVDHGIWRRLRLIPFNVTIPESQRDAHLLDTLKTEAPAILAWMVQGCLAWQRNGLGMPEAVLEATGGFRSESDQVGVFLEECCTLADGVFVLKAKLFEAYRQWCLNAGEHPLKKNAFGTRIKKRGFKDKKVHAGRVWVGIELSSITEVPDA
jgi:putative DNA primase/helicase